MMDDLLLNIMERLKEALDSDNLISCADLKIVTEILKDIHEIQHGR